MQVSVHLKYDGPDLRRGMDADEVAAAIDGFSQYLKTISYSTFGEASELEFLFTSVHRRSLDLGFLLEIAAVGMSLSQAFPAGITDIKGLFDVVKSSFQLLLHLNGNQP